jgi:hypothetical protein
MRVLVACEESQEVCKAFRALGHEAYSCDLQECSGGHPEWHYQRDIKLVLMHPLNQWDLVIAHPPCTRLANSGVRWLLERQLWSDLYDACQFFALFQLWQRVDPLNRKLAIENPIPHKYAREVIGDYSQVIQPWQFGHGEQKATCLWLYNLPELKPTNIVDGREQRIWKMAPGENRTKERSKTFPGIARAMAEQWGGLAIEKVNNTSNVEL